MDAKGIEGPSQICRVVHHMNKKNNIDSNCPKSGYFLGKSKFQIPKINVTFRKKFKNDNRKIKIEIAGF